MLACQGMAMGLGIGARVSAGGIRVDRGAASQTIHHLLLLSFLSSILIVLSSVPSFHPPHSLSSCLL